MYVGHIEAFGNLLIEDPEMAKLQDESAQRVEASPQLLEVRRRWAACMRERGFDFDSSQAVVDSLGIRLSDLEARLGRLPNDGDAELRALQSDERRLYSNDRECDKEVGFTETLEAVVTSIESELVERAGLD
jgi:hypothetical protein